MDQVPGDLDTKINELLSLELEQRQLVLLPSCGGKGLFTNRSVPDGDLILEATALLFTEAPLLMSFLKNHEQHGDACFKVSPVLNQGVATSVFLWRFSCIESNRNMYL